MFNMLKTMGKKHWAWGSISFYNFTQKEYDNDLVDF